MNCFNRRSLVLSRWGWNDDVLDWKFRIWLNQILSHFQMNPFVIILCQRRKFDRVLESHDIEDIGCWVLIHEVDKNRFSNCCFKINSSSISSSSGGCEFKSEVIVIEVLCCLFIKTKWKIAHFVLNRHIEFRRGIDDIDNLISTWLPMRTYMNEALIWRELSISFTRVHIWSKWI